MRSWYTEAQLTQNWQVDIERDTITFFSDDFAAQFAKNCAEIGLPAEMFRHRLLETDSKQLIAGIRFLGMDLAHPFVEVAQISTPVHSDAERDAITALLREAFAPFQPQRWRIYQSSHLTYQFADCDSDKRYLVGLLTEIAARPPFAADGNIELKVTTQLDFYERYAAMYEQLFAERPWLPDIARQESLEDFQSYLAEGALYEIWIDGKWAGITGVVPGCEVGALGQLVIELVLDKPFRGRGLAAPVQRKLAELLAARSASNAALLGTIGAVNTPMLKTAVRVGRSDVGGHYWVSF